MAVVDATVVLDEILLRHAILDLGIVRIGVEQDRRVGQYICGVYETMNDCVV